jgi:hypothetical protein
VSRKTRLWTPPGVRQAPRPGVTRRGVLRGLLAGAPVALTLPWLESLGGGAAHAAESGFPKRFVLWYWGNGNRPEAWLPTDEGDSWTLTSQLAPLADFQHKLSLVTGYAVKVENVIPHGSGMAGLLTGLQADGDDDDWSVAGPTFDQLLAQQIGDDTVYRSLNLGIGGDDSVSYSGANAYNPADSDPFTVYEMLFGDTFREPGEEGLVDPHLGYRRSALDGVLEELNSLSARVSADDQIRLEAHADAVRELEIRLARLEENPASFEACTYPSVPETDYPDIEGRPQLVARNQAMAELAAMALACDQTRCMSYTFTKPLYNGLFQDVEDGHHNLTHDEAGDQPQVESIATQVMSGLADFMRALDAIPEADGTLLDHTLIMACSETSEGQTHALEEIPLIFAGGASGGVQMGRHVRSWTQENVNKALLSALRGMDLTLSSLGSGDTYTEDGVSELEG